MTLLALLRHGPTEWSAARRLQGRTDIPLSDHGRAVVAGWRLPPSVAGFAWVTSPLARCIETAETLRSRLADAPRLRIEPRLVEMSFGDWEGETLADLRHRYGARMAAWESRGLDFQPPAGESPRIVQERLRPWLVELAADRIDTLAITHKSVMRALYALATGWDMRTKPPQRLLPDAAQLFEVDGRGDIRIAALNLPLDLPRASIEGR